jgi:hypothetical protein
VSAKLEVRTMVPTVLLTMALLPSYNMHTPKSLLAKMEVLKTCVLRVCSGPPRFSYCVSSKSIDQVNLVVPPAWMIAL